MRKSLSVLLAASLVLAGCGGWGSSRVNPMNWFGQSRSVAVDTASASNPLMPARSRVFAKAPAEDKSLPIARVTELRIEQTTTGAIVYAEGIAGRQGPYQTELRPASTEEEAEAGILVLSFRVVYPPYDTPAGSELTRTVHEAHTLSGPELRAIKLIRVTGRDNAMESRRK
jgi:hypothetical protein